MTNSKARWIWYPGDFELYHNLLVHSRRQEFDSPCLCCWTLSRPEFVCIFTKTVRTDKRTSFRVYAKGKAEVSVDGVCIDCNREQLLEPGEHRIRALISEIETFPALFIAGEALYTDGTWLADRYDGRLRPVGCEPSIGDAAADPAVFPFCYEILQPVSVKEVKGRSGRLYDFGRESFGPVTVERSAAQGDVFICYGESEEEALDREHALVRQTLSASDGPYECPARAFRYIYIEAENGAPDIVARSEYLPIDDIASFTCDDPLVKPIWDLCAHTFHLNSREFYLDGIKRDRWVWSGDAYQSYTVNRYLYFDTAIIRRTIRALLGKPPYRHHINTINDYSAYLILSVWEYYFSTGDKAFVEEVWDNLHELYRFIVSRLDERGYVVQRPGDWIFIDWANIDKEGAVCAEQILLWQTYNAMAGLSAVLGQDNGAYMRAADVLRRNIMRDYWDESRSAFIDSCESGKRNITRHANIFAILYDFVDEKTAETIVQNVLTGDIAEPITTPYFKFFELTALCKMGRVEEMQSYLDSYWGGMLALGATSVWEQYIPAQSGTEHLAMYGKRYGCSLCHAWGAGPIALLGQYCAGVEPTSVGYKTFEVKPRPGRYKTFDAVVPVNGGTVSVAYRDGVVTAKSTVAGGTLVFAGQRLAIPTGEAVVIRDDS